MYEILIFHLPIPALGLEYHSNVLLLTKVFQLLKVNVSIS